MYNRPFNTRTDECYSCKLIEPIYDFGNDVGKFRKFLYTFIVVLWCITLLRFYINHRNGKLNEFIDLFRC